MTRVKDLTNRNLPRREATSIVRGGNASANHRHASGSESGAKAIAVGHHEGVFEASAELSSAFLRADAIFEELEGE